MAKRLIWVLVVLMLLARTPRAFAMSELILVTRDNQAKVGVQFSLSAEQVSETAVIFRMEIPRKGKLKELRRVNLDIGDYKPGVGSSPTVSANLETTEGRGGSLIVSFQLSPQMAEQGSILLGPLTPLTPTTEYYSVELKSYITDGPGFLRSNKKAAVQWGPASDGFQLGARISGEKSVFKPGDTITFETHVRNLSGKDAQLSVGNYWKVNYQIEVQTADGKPVYVRRDAQNQPTEVAGYIEESFPNGLEQPVSKAVLQIGYGRNGTELARMGSTEAWVETVPLRPGRYRIRVVSRGVLSMCKPEPASGWIPMEVR